MPSRTRVFVYEYLSGGGAADVIDRDDDLLHQGASMRDALVADLAALDNVAVTYAALPSAVSVSPAPRGAPSAPRRGEDAIGFVRRQSLHHDVVCVIAPETANVLSALCQAVEDGRWLGCDLDAIRITTSKRATATHLACHGIATTRPAMSSSADPSTRWVVKPDDGAGACDTRVHASLRDAQSDMDARARQGHAATLERWEDGEPLSLSLLCDGRHAELLAINRQRIDVDADGALHYRGVEIDIVPLASSLRSTMERLAARVASALPGLRGYVGIDVTLHPQRGPIVIEINPRLTCSYVGLSATLGRNVAAAMLDAHRRRLPLHVDG